MYSQNPVVNDLVLTIINDGNGSQCGMDYKSRCAAADTGIWEFRADCRAYGRQRSKSGSSSPSRTDIIEAATILQNYYRDHMKEQEYAASLPPDVTYIPTLDGGHNSREKNEDFRRASDETNARWRAGNNTDKAVK